MKAKPGFYADEVGLKTNFSIREKINLDSDHQLICWRNDGFTETRFDHAIKVGIDKWEVRASFKYLSDFMHYIRSNNFEPTLK